MFEGMRLIKTIREARELSQYGLAKQLGVPSTTILAAEKKGRSLRLDILAKLRKISGLSWTEFGRLIDQEFLDDETTRRRK